VQKVYTSSATKNRRKISTLI